MPFIPNADLTAPQILIGEICADLIKTDWPNVETIKDDDKITISLLPGRR